MPKMNSTFDNSQRDYEPNGIISTLFDRKQHISYDIALRNEKMQNTVYLMMKKLDSENVKCKYFSEQREKEEK